MSKGAHRRTDPPLQKARGITPPQAPRHPPPPPPHPRRNFRQPLTQITPIDGKIRLRRTHRQTKRDKPLLRTVMQIALDPTASLIRSRNNPPTRRRELRRAFRVRNRRRDELRERSESRLGVRWHKPFFRGSRHEAPDMAFD